MSIIKEKILNHKPATSSSQQQLPHLRTAATTANNNNQNSRQLRHHLPTPIPLNGFEKAVLVGGDKVVANFTNYIRIFTISNHAWELEDVKCEGEVASLQSSPDFNHFALSIDAPQGAKIVMFDSRDMGKAVREFSTVILATQIRISLTNETILLFAEAEDNQKCRIALYAFDGSFLSENSITLSNPSKYFEISFCPADETIICVISDEQCYFMRATTNVISVFSTIKFFDVTCHAWVDDVTLGFGTHDGQIRLYRETVPLEVVNLKTLQNNLIGDYDPKQSHVVKMFGNDQYLLAYIQIGVIFVFPAGPLKERWKNSKAIILNSIKVDTVCRFLHMDQANDNILFGDSESISLCNVNYAEAICDNGLRLITAKNSAPIMQICYEHRSKTVGTLDRNGLILVTSMINKRTISYGIFKNAIGIAILPHGHKILVANSDGIFAYHVLFQELLEDGIIWSEKVEVLVQNQTSDKIAIANSSHLTVLSTEDFTQMLRIPLESNQEIITLKWSASSQFIGIIAAKDTIYLIGTVEGKILWSHEYKLRFFVDIAIHENAIFALGNKFTVARFLGKKELDSMNVHFEGVSFNSTSTSILTTPDAYFYGTKMGILLKAPADNVENVQQIKLGGPDNVKGICAMIWIESENIILTGHDDGNLIILDLNLPESPHASTASFENIALCRINAVEKNKFLSKELEVERNLIRKQAKKIFEEFKEKKEKEIKELNETLETNMQAMRDKIKIMENKFESSEAAKEEVIAKMKADFKNGMNEQKQFYENMINDQIKGSLEKDDTNKICMEKVQKMHKQELHKLQFEWEAREKELLKEIAKNKGNTDKAIKKLFESESLRKMTILQISDEEKKFYQTLKALKQKYEEEQRQFGATIKDLKATILIIENEKGAEVQNVRQQKTRLEALSDELAENQNLFDEKNALIEKQQDQITKSERECEKLTKQVQKLTQKTSIVSKDIEHEKHLRRNAESRLKAFEAMVEAMSLEIYDSRKLERNAMAMLGFFKSPNQLLQRSKSHVISVRTKKG